MRPLIRYDLDEPLTSPTTSTGPLAPPRGHARRPPTKKHKPNHPNQKRSQFASSREMPLQHWDDPGSAVVGMVYDEQEGSATSPTTGSVTVPYADDVKEEEGECSVEPAVEGDEAIDVDVDVDVEEEEEEEESRALTHEEIWDDAALIDAWNSAEAEYKVLFPLHPLTRTPHSHPLKAYHGASKAWKTEPVKKSPLCVP